MPRIRDVLYRFRPAAAPGAASGAGVPVDRGAELAAELAPVFAQLEDTERVCAAIRARAEQDATTARSAAAERAGAITASAHERAGAERAAVVTAVREAAQTRLADDMRAAAAEAAEIHRRAARRMPVLVAQVATYVDELLAGAAPQSQDAPEAGHG